jgi:Na+/proline symporter
MTAKLWRRTRAISPVEYTYTRYNITTQQFLGWVIAINFTLSAGVQLAATCILLAPVLGMDILTVTLVTGVVILLYTFLGGVWAVSITDVVQGVILLCTACIVVPLSLGLVGGVGPLLDAMPPLTFEHTYNGVTYDEHWILSIIIISTLGFAGGSGQRFYSVQDEKSALKVGWFAAALAMTGPLMLGIPPLVARVIWPDLSQVEFFQPYLNNNPQDLVYIALTLKFLPNGLIGVFLAAMLAATMSTLSAVYNMVSAILTRDVYQGFLRPSTTDDQLLKVGRIISLGIGIFVTALAAVFVTSQFGIFNLMQAFFTLFNIPVSVPMAFGLLFRGPPRWSAVGAICWGLLAGVAGRYLLGWRIGPQVYLAAAMTLSIYMASPWLADLYRRNKTLLAGLAVAVTLGTGFLFSTTVMIPDAGYVVPLAWVVAAAFGVSLVYFSSLFTRETDEGALKLREFFRKLDTPVDVQKEVFGAGKKQVSVFPITGATMLIMAALLTLVFFTDLSGGEAGVLALLIGLMVIAGGAMWYLGRRVERQAATHA